LIHLLLLCSITTGVIVGQKRDLLSKSYSADYLRKTLATQSSWQPFPKASERTSWEALPQALKKAYIGRGEEALEYQWPDLAATLYLSYVRKGIRTEYDRPYHERRQKLQSLVLAECMEGKGRFLDKIAEGIWLLSEESSWVVPAHLSALQSAPGLPDLSSPVVDLYCGETANLLAWMYYLLGDELSRVSPLLPERIKHELNTRLLTPCMHRDDFWWMMTPGKEQPGRTINNWTSWICSNWLAAVLLVEENDEARQRSISRIAMILDRFVNSYPDDGGVDEGPNYWNHSVGSLYESLVLLGSATRTTSPLMSHPLIREMGRYIYRTHVADDYFVTISDSPVKIPFPSSLAVLFGRDVHDEYLSELGGALALRQGIFTTGIRGSMTRQLFFLFNADRIRNQTPRQPLLRDVWLPQTQFFAARERADTSKGFYLAAQGLHNGKSHNHNDVGNFLLYVDGKPFIIDVGPEGYNAKTFSSSRYDIWTTQSAFHNLPTINGVMESNGRQYAARDVRYQSWRDSVIFSLDIAGVFAGEANVKKWVRSIKMDRTQGAVLVREDYILGAAPKDLTLTLMTSGRVLNMETDRLVVRVGNVGEGHRPIDVEIHFEPDKLHPTVETIKIEDEELRAEWGSNLQRILLKAKNPLQAGSFTVSFRRSLK